MIIRRIVLSGAFCLTGCVAMYDWELSTNRKDPKDGSPDDAGRERDAKAPSPPPPRVQDAGVDADASGPDGCPECERVVFLTIGTFQGGGIVGLRNADQLCANAAAASPLPRVKGRTFFAWLSTPESPVSSRFVHGTSPYILPSGKLVAANWDALVSGMIQNPIREASNGGTAAIRRLVWTGTRADGTTATQTCGGNWANVNDNAILGWSDATDKSWTEAVADKCDMSLNLYCFER